MIDEQGCHVSLSEAERFWIFETVLVFMWFGEYLWMIKLDLAGNLPSREKLIFANCTEFGWTWAYYRPRLQGFSKIRIIMSVYVQILCFSWKLLIVALIYRTKYSCIPYAISFQKMYIPTFTTYLQWVGRYDWKYKCQNYTPRASRMEYS